jgi:hypothetical protein
MGLQAVFRWVAFAVSASVLVACGSGSDEPARTSDTRKAAGRTAAAAPRFDTPGTVVLLWCNSVDATTRVMLSAVSLRDGGTVASTTFELPEAIKPSVDCENYDSTAASSVPVRSMFDRSLRRMAVTVTDDTTNAERASTVGVPGGVPAELPPAAGGFTSTPDQEHAVFKPGTDELWFIDTGADQVMSLDPATGRTTSHGAPTGDGQTIAVGPEGYFVADSGWATYDPVVAPDGKDAMIDSHLVHLGKSPEDSPQIGGFSNPVPGDKKASCGSAQAWLDDQRLLCDNHSGTGPEFALVTFSPGRKSITGFRDDLLPKTDLTSFSPVLSPDHNSFAFLTLQGQRITLFTQSFIPGATPMQVADVQPPTQPEDTLGQTLTPTILTWQ